MLRSVLRRRLWEYPADTPVEVLLRHRRRAYRIAYAWIASGAILMSSLVEFLLAPEGLAQTASMTIFIVACVVNLLLMLPAVAATAWSRDIGRALAAGGGEVPSARPLEARLAREAIRFFLWLGVLVVVVRCLMG